MLGIPVKVNIDSGGSRNGIPERRRTAVGAKRRWHGDCGVSVRIVKRDCPERSGGRFGGILGCRGKGQQPLCPCFPRCRRRNSFLDLSCGGLRFAHRFSTHLNAMSVMHQAGRGCHRRFSGDRRSVRASVRPAVGSENRGTGLVRSSQISQTSRRSASLCVPWPSVDDQKNRMRTQSCQEVAQSCRRLGPGRDPEVKQRPQTESGVAVATGFLRQGQSDKALAHAATVRSRRCSRDCGPRRVLGQSTHHRLVQPRAAGSRCPPRRPVLSVWPLSVCAPAPGSHASSIVIDQQRESFQKLSSLTPRSCSCAFKASTCPAPHGRAAFLSAVGSA